MKSYIGHHTCKNEGGYNYVLREAPFLSMWPEEGEDDMGRKTPFLGEGYYFWEYDLKQAKWWGENFYENAYYIFEGSINTNDTNFLDFIGDTQKIGEFMLVLRKLVAHNEIQIDFNIGEAIEYLKKSNELSPGLFPYLIIRAQDYKHLHSATKLYFNELGHYTYVNTRHIICLLQKDDIILSNRKIVFSSVI